MADVVLVKFEPENEIHGFAPPFGILFLADALEKAGFTVRLIHEVGSRSIIARLVEDVVRDKPLFVGFSSFTSSILLPTAAASREIRRVSDVPIVWGGIHSTILPEQTLANEFIDVICIGEGEETIVELARSAGPDGWNLETLRGIKGIGYHVDGRPVVNEFRPFLGDPDRFSPAWHLVDVGRYIYRRDHFYTQIGSRLQGQSIAAMITSRGCPWRCAYCYNQAVNRRSFRARSASSVVAEIEFLKSRGASTIIFEDDNFFGNKQRVLDIVRNVDVKWSSTVRADYLAKWGEDFVAELSRRGCVEVRIGAESGSPLVLGLMQKDITIEHIRRAVDLCARNGIQTLLNFMVGVPGETWNDVLATLALMDDLEANYDNVSIGSPAVYIPWPGTELSQEAARRGFEAPDTLEGWATYWAQRADPAPYQDRRIMFIGFYKSLLRRDFRGVPFPFLARQLQRFARLRWRKRFFSFPLDYHVPAFFLRSLRHLGLRRFALALYQ